MDGEIDLVEIVRVLKLALRAAGSACEHAWSQHEYGARRGCGGCRAVVELKALIERLTGERVEWYTTFRRGK